MGQTDLVVELYKCLGNKTRYEILKSLIDGKKCVTKINEMIGFSQPNISQHLIQMRKAGILTCEKNGLQICYRIVDNRIIELINLAEAIVSKNEEE